MRIHNGDFTQLIKPVLSVLLKDWMLIKLNQLKGIGVLGNVVQIIDEDMSQCLNTQMKVEVEVALLKLMALLLGGLGEVEN